MIHFEHPCLIKDPCFNGLKHIGYWYPSEKRILGEKEIHRLVPGARSSSQWEKALTLPRVADFVDPSWDGPDRSKVITYLKVGGRVNYSYDGWSDCRICGQANGSDDFTDGTWGWPEGYVHYVEQHWVKPPEEFIAHVLVYR